MQPIVNRLHNWFRKNARDLPWRRTQDPYPIWLSEVMLQQTRVETVIDYYHRFLTAFPDVHALADANDDRLLVVWEGLGYYRRARNLRDAARVVRDEWLKEKGHWPRTAEEWQTLPGVGRYTAAAVASIAFDESVAVLDGNVKRVLARLFLVEEQINTPTGEKKLWDLADELVPDADAGLHNQALMELGATVCTPRRPKCGECPVRDECGAFAQKRVEELPRKKPKPQVPHVNAVAAVIAREDGALLIRRRPDEAMLGGLWELPVVEEKRNDDSLKSLREEIILILSSPGDGAAGLYRSLEVGEPVAQARHAYSHFTIKTRAFEIRPRISTIQAESLIDKNGYAWLTKENRDQFALHRAHDKLVRQLWDRQERLRLNTAD